MRLNRNMPDAVVFGTVKHGGMEFPEAYALQDQLQMTDVIRQLRWDKTVANDILVTLDNIQLNAGFVTPIMELQDHKWIVWIRDFLPRCGGEWE